MRNINAAGCAAAVGGYSHATMTGRDLLFISGQTPEAVDGSVAAEPEAQLRQVWANIVAVLAAADLGVGDLVHVRTYLADRACREVSARVRSETLGDHSPALTVVICGLYEDGWAAEIEAVAESPAPA